MKKYINDEELVRFLEDGLRPQGVLLPCGSLTKPLHYHSIEDLRDTVRSILHLASEAKPFFWAIALLDDIIRRSMIPDGLPQHPDLDLHIRVFGKRLMLTPLSWATLERMIMLGVV